MSAHVNVLGGTAMLFNILKGPGYGCGCVLNVHRRLDPGMQPVIYCHHCDSLFLQFFGHTTVARLETATMKPDQSGEAFEMLGMIDIQAATLFHVVIQFTRVVEDISGAMIKGLGLLSLSRSQKKEENENG